MGPPRDGQKPEGRPYAISHARPVGKRAHPRGGFAVATGCRTYANRRRATELTDAPMLRPATARGNRHQIGTASEGALAHDGGRHGLRRLSAPARRIWSDHRAHFLSPTGSSVAAAVVCLAGLRPVPRVSGIERLPDLLAGIAR